MGMRQPILALSGCASALGKQLKSNASGDFEILGVPPWSRRNRQQISVTAHSRLEGGLN